MASTRYNAYSPSGNVNNNFDKLNKLNDKINVINVIFYKICLLIFILIAEYFGGRERI